jgi:hypothetical protein
MAILAANRTTIHARVARHLNANIFPFFRIALIVTAKREKRVEMRNSNYLCAATLQTSGGARVW